MKQVLIIHGGESFSSYDQYMKSLSASPVEYESLKLRKKWKPWIAEQMPEVDVLLPTFPNGYNAVYDEWVVYFEKLVPFFGDDIRLVGHSLGAMFLAKYLNEKPLTRKVRQLVLIAGGYDDDSYEDLGSFGVSSAANVPKSADEVHLFHSRDDFVVPYAELAKFEQDMPTATVHSFDDRGHFNAETFPELLELLKQK